MGPIYPDRPYYQAANEFTEYAEGVHVEAFKRGGETKERLRDMAAQRQTSHRPIL